MSVVVAEGVVVIDADARDVGPEIAREVDKGAPAAGAAGKRVGVSVFKGILGSAIVLKGLDVVGQFFGGAIRGSTDLNETISKSKTIFGDAYKSVERWGDGASKALGLSKAAALEAAANFGNMFTQLGYTADAAADVSQKTVQMAADLGSFNNIPTADVADRISAALRGEYDSLQALIPNINAARVEQEAMTISGKANADELTAQEKAAAVLAIVARDGSAAMGDYARTADGAANTQKTLTASLEDQQAKLGTVLMPIWREFLSFLTTTAIPTLTTIVGWIDKNKEQLGPWAIAVGVATAALWALNAALYANPIVAVAAAVVINVGAIVAAITFLSTNWNTIMLGIEATNRRIVGNITSTFSGIVSTIRGTINNAISLANMAIGRVNTVTGAFGIPKIGSIPMLAAGGKITGGGSVMVGERGPEILNLPRGASVVPLDRVNTVSGGEKSFHLTQKIYATDPILGARQAAREAARYLGV